METPISWILLIYVAASVVAFVAYGLDKRAAVRGRWRITETTLHAIELVGGFPGAFLGQHVFRHKRSKVRYMIVFWLIVLVHGIGWVAWWRFR
ncbi:MAG: DUF1294 domain-containing protein [Planctomycetota bacterium]|jgi:uncharacterized membrane protein YsdA (DUF1294 family)